MADYTTRIGKTVLEYTLEGRVLRCQCPSEPALSHEMALDAPQVILKPIRKFRIQFQLGMLGVAIPIWTFGVIYIKERHLGLSNWSSYPHFAFFAIGVVLLLRYRRPLRGHLVTADKKTGINIWRDPDGNADFDGFISRLRTEIQKA